MNTPSATLKALPSDALRRHGLLEAADARRTEWVCGRAGLRNAEDAEAVLWVVAALCHAETLGNLCLPLDPKALGASVRGLLAEAEQDATRGDAMAERVLALLEAGVLEAIVGDADSDADAEGETKTSGNGMMPRPLVGTHGNLYWHKAWSAARTVADGIRARCQPDPDDGVDGTATAAAIAAALAETLTNRPLRRADGNAGEVLKLTDAQQRALEGALTHKAFIVAGGPGTGKTTWTAAWLRAILRLPGVTPERIRLCAPTGRAARRLEESLRATLAYCLDDPRDAAAAALPVTTLHTLLGGRAFEGRFARTPGDPLDADWVLLDEASMADVHLMAALVRAMRPGTRLVLAGDPGQLPAVEAGAVLGELLPAADGEPGPVPSVTLDASHRATGAVIPLAAAIRAGRGDDVVGLLGSPIDPAAAFAPDRALTRVEASDDATAHGGAEHLSKVLHAYADAAFGRGAGGSTAPTYAALLERFRTLPREDEPAAAGALWNLAGRARVLAPLRQGTVSAESANRILRQRLEPAWRHRTDGRDPKGFHGAPILITRNDARTGLSNGDLGLWLETGDGATVFFPRPELPGGWLRLPVALLPAWELGFASTVHKSQGSECDEVLVLLPAADNRLLVRETLYTAVTRARKTVRIYGSDLAIRQAVERRLQRYGGLREMLTAE